MFESYTQNLKLIDKKLTCATNEDWCARHVFRGQSGDYPLVPSVGRDDEIKKEIASNIANMGNHLSLIDLVDDESKILKEPLIQSNIQFENGFNFQLRILLAFTEKAILENIVQKIEKHQSCSIPNQNSEYWSYSEIKSECHQDQFYHPTSLRSLFDIYCLDKIRPREEAIFSRFVARSCSNFSRKYNLWEYLALAQHHGCPTRLLDWSETVDVPLFFAVDGFTDPKQDEAYFYIYHCCEIINIAAHPFEKLNPLRLFENLVQDFFDWLEISGYKTPKEIVDYLQERVLYSYFVSSEDSANISIDLEYEAESSFSHYLMKKYDYTFDIPYIFQIILGMPILIRIPAVIERINAQYGLFTYHPFPHKDFFNINIDSSFKNIQLGRGRDLIKIMLNSLFNLKQDLYWKGVRSENIFGDTDNIAKAISKMDFYNAHLRV